VAADGGLLFDGLHRGIGGAAITARCHQETAMLRSVIAGLGSPLELISVGGVGSAAEVRERLRAGANHVQIATAAMIDPMIGIRIRQEGC
jgi:dihydroorotate dehydrogenase